tara:strand:- start:10128 stop:10844 length:717 start_codon:yes stop_codon:yes gene_type:complete
MSMLGPYFGIFEHLGLCKKEPMRPTTWFYKGEPFTENFWGVSDVDKEKLRGVVHIGAHDMAEGKDYGPLFGKNVIFFEANPESYKNWVHPACEHYGWLGIHAAATNVNGPIELYLTGNADNSSLHAKAPETTDKVFVDGKRLDTFFELTDEVDINDYNFLNVDVEGAELKVLEGLGELLYHFDYILLEVAMDKRFGDEDVTFDEITDWLYERGYGVELVSDSMTSRRWGDALYVKRPR